MNELITYVTLNSVELIAIVVGLIVVFEKIAKLTPTEN